MKLRRHSPRIRRVWLEDVERKAIELAGVLVRGDDVLVVRLAPRSVNDAVCPSHAVVLPARLGRRLIRELEAARDETYALLREDFAEPWLAREREQERLGKT